MYIQMYKSISTCLNTLLRLLLLLLLLVLFRFYVLPTDLDKKNRFILVEFGRMRDWLNEIVAWKCPRLEQVLLKVLFLASTNDTVLKKLKMLQMTGYSCFCICIFKSQGGKTDPAFKHLALLMQESKRLKNWKNSSLRWL